MNPDKLPKNRNLDKDPFSVNNGSSKHELGETDSQDEEGDESEDQTREEKGFSRRMLQDDYKSFDQWREKSKRRTEDRSTVDGVLDLSTSRIINKYMRSGHIKGLRAVIATGKESNVYYVQSGDVPLTKGYTDIAVKVYRTSTLDFKKIKEYIVDDRRFKSKSGNKVHQIIEQWAKKEYKNLSRARSAGVTVPDPIDVRRNVLLMQFIGTVDIDPETGNVVPIAALPLVNLQNDRGFLKEAAMMYSRIMTDVEILWTKAGIVHGDLSEYNVLGLPPSHPQENFRSCIIDISQGVVISHNAARKFLLRDLFSINSFFGRLKVKDEIPIVEHYDMFSKIVGEDPTIQDEQIFEGK